MPPPSSQETADSTVRHGDVLVRTVGAGMGAAYAFSISGRAGSEEVVFASMREASRHAREYARRVDVDAWVAQGAWHVVRVARCRRPGDRAL